MSDNNEQQLLHCITTELLEIICKRIPEKQLKAIQLHNNIAPPHSFLEKWNGQCYHFPLQLQSSTLRPSLVQLNDRNLGMGLCQ